MNATSINCRSNNLSNGSCSTTWCFIEHVWVVLCRVFGDLQIYEHTSVIRTIWKEWHWLIEISCVCRFRIISNHMSSCSWWVLFTCINMSCEVSSIFSMFFQQVLPITAWSRIDPIAPQGDLFGDQVRCGMIPFFRCNRTLRHISTPCRSFAVQKGSQNFRRWRFLLKDVWRGWEPLPSANVLHPNAYWKPRLRLYSLLKGGWGGLHSHKDTWQG